MVISFVVIMMNFTTPVVSGTYASMNSELVNLVSVMVDMSTLTMIPLLASSVLSAANM